MLPALLYGRLFVPQCVNGVQLGGLVGRKVSKQHADAHADTEADEDGAEGGCCVEGNTVNTKLCYQYPAQDGTDAHSHQAAEQNAHQTADGGGSARLDDELAADVPALGLGAQDFL